MSQRTNMGRLASTILSDTRCLIGTFVSRGNKMDEVKEMVSEWLKFRNDNEEREFKISEDAEMRNEQIRRDFAEQGRMYDPYY